MDGSVSFYNGATTSALGIYNKSTATGAAAGWAPYTSTNTCQQWYLEPVAYQRGDVNIDGTINATDALMVSQSTAGTRTLSDLEKYLADVNGDGQVNTADAQMINQISVGTIE